MKVRIELVRDWERTGVITFAQAQKLARVTNTPFGYLFLPEPPHETLEELGLADFRTLGDVILQPPSPDLIETVQQMQHRQAWMREDLIESGAEQLKFVGSATLQEAPETIAQQMRVILGLPDAWAGMVHTWGDALRQLRQAIEDAGILIFINGIVGNNTHRPLSVQEFRGFALCDPYAPVIFVNGVDGQAAQMFTLVHETAHLWLGVDGVSNLDILEPSPMPVERFCNAVAAEFLVPAQQLARIWPNALDSGDAFAFTSRHFKVSPIVAARRAKDLKHITNADYAAFYRRYEDNERHSKKHRGSGGHFWNTQNVRVGRRFGSAVARAAKEGRLLYRDAYRLTGLRGQTFEAFAQSVGVRLR